MAAVLGITVAPEGDPGPCRGKVFVANHITKLDHLSVHVVTSALKVCDILHFYLSYNQNFKLAIFVGNDNEITK